MTQKYSELIRLAEEARGRSYCPYSKKSVGAALLADSGKIYTGANIECSSFSPTVCAERVALFSAVHSGERHFEAIAIAGSELGKEISSPFTPCGVCRQMLSEFCSAELKVLVRSSEGVRCFTLGELLPHAFSIPEVDL